MRSERNENIDLFKGVGIILVIAGHSIQRGLLGFDNSPVLFVELNKIIELFNMPLFFLISGWLFAKTGGVKKNLFAWIWHRVIRILYPWFIWRWILWSVRGLSFTGLSPWYDDLPSSPYKYLITFIKNFAGKPLWFLPTLFICGCLIAIVWKLCRTDDYRLVFVVVTMIAGTIVFHLISNNYLEQYLFFYSIGVICGMPKCELIYKNNKNVPIVIAVFLVAIYCAMKVLNYTPIVFTYLKKYLIGSALCIMFCIIISWIRARIEDMQSESLRYKICSTIKNYTIFIGKNSLEFYLIEFLFLNIGLKSNAYVSIVSIFCTCLGISSVAVYMIKKYLKPVNAVLFGYFRPLNCLKKL